MLLSEEQLTAINAPDKNRLLLAGPGTGKSNTILGHIASLVKSGVKPNEIFVLTFTRAATADLKNRIKIILKDSPELPHVSTLHSFALRQLMKNSSSIKSLPANFTIADDFEERHIIVEDLKRLLKIPSVDDVLDYIQKLSSNWETLNADTNGWEKNFDMPELIGAWQEHREIYGYALRAELVYQLKNLLAQTADPKLDTPITFLIVDEYQDLNKCEIRVVEKLRERGARLFCAGDDDQSIYGFRFAYPEGIRQFVDVTPDSKKFEIVECHRCDKKILDLALNVIKQDYKRASKKIQSMSKYDGEVFLLRFDNQDNEAKTISQLISSLPKKGIEFSSTIILLRSDYNSAFSKVIANELNKLKIPIAKQVNDYSLFEGEQGRYFTALIKFLGDENNSLSIRTLLQLTPGIGSTTIDTIYSLAKDNRLRFSNAVSKIYSEEILLKGQKALNETIKNLFELRKECLQLNELSKILGKVFEKVPLLNDNNFLDRLNSFITVNSVTSKDDLIATINDYTGPKEPAQFGEGVRIMSMHQAKGLTADAVIVVGVEEEYIPGKGDVDEERRLLYVSLTRAKHWLAITYCNERTGQQQHSGYMPSGKTTKRNLSRFLKEIPTLESLPGEKFL